MNGLTARILRADVARYMIKTLEDDLHHKKIVAMGTKWQISIFFEMIVISTLHYFILMNEWEWYENSITLVAEENLWQKFFSINDK